MAGKSEFYKGRRKKRDKVTIPAIIIMGLIAVLVVIFYGAQKYAVITKDGVSVELPLLEKNKTTVDEEGNVVRQFDQVDAAITYDDPDYSGVEQMVSGDVQPIRAIFVSADELDSDTVMAYAARLSSGNALVLEMKPANGTLMWNCTSSLAQNYGLYSPTSVTEALPDLITALKEDGVYLAAQISCCVDYILPSRCTSVGLTNQWGVTYSDEVGTWLDPYNTQVRDYVIDMINDLYNMGFDEVILENVRHPVITDEEMVLNYTKAMSTVPTPVNAVCGMALAIAKEFEDRDSGKYLSIYVDSATALVKADTSNGQDGPLFEKLFDRVYYSTDRYTYSFNVEDMNSSVTVGNVYDRFVPVVVNYLPDSTSWVLIDTETESD